MPNEPGYVRSLLIGDRPRTMFCYSEPAECSFLGDLFEKEGLDQLERSGIDIAHQARIARGRYPILFVSYGYTFEEDIRAQDVAKHLSSRIPDGQEMSFDYRLAYVSRDLADEICEKLFQNLYNREGIMHEQRQNKDYTFNVQRGHRLALAYFALMPLPHACASA